MHRKALELAEVLGHKEGMATAYSNLGIVYHMRRDLAQAELMYRKALTLFQEIGKALQVTQTQKILRALHTEGSP
jgi:Flp pilus assembly protein TadD